VDRLVDLENPIAAPNDDESLKFSQRGIDLVSSGTNRNLPKLHYFGMMKQYTLVHTTRYEM
jgi:hypothetical protein